MEMRRHQNDNDDDDDDDEDWIYQNINIYHIYLK